MLKNLNKIWVKIIRELKSHPTNYILLTTILFFGLFVRVYRTLPLLGFYFDQGRDAMVIWKLWHENRPFLIGPVTGLQGIFLGPLYYYLIAPFYLIGRGNPATPAMFLAFLSTIATFFLYFLGWKIYSRTTGLIAVTVGAFSLNLVKAARWLANPTPILLTSMLLLWVMWEIVDSKFKSKSMFKRKILWMATALLIGVSLQFEAASAIFYLPMILVFVFWQKKNLPNKKTFLISVALFFLTLLPQILFNARHDNILLDNFKRILVEENSFRISFWQVLGTRLSYFWDVFSSKIVPDYPIYAGFFTAFASIALVVKKKTRVFSEGVKLLMIFLGIPMIGFIFFQGNFGNIYDYYMTGYYLPIILLFCLGLGLFWKIKAGKFVIVAFFILFFIRNGSLLRYYLIAGVDGPSHISLGNELQAVDWVFESSKDVRNFNVDVYVPPVIPHSYDYLFLWQATKRCGEDLCGMVLDSQVSRLYTLYEVDPPHPWRLDAWLERQKGIGVVEDETSFGGITVQRRTRL